MACLSNGGEYTEVGCWEMGEDEGVLRQCQKRCWRGLIGLNFW